jgi:V8-like Glu-specific endopeptidase
MIPAAALVVIAAAIAALSPVGQAAAFASDRQAGAPAPATVPASAVPASAVPTSTPTPTPAPTPSASTSPAPVATSFAGTTAVGALFAVTKNGVRHFCTAAVVHSPHGNVVITAAHCLRGRNIGPKGDVFFEPGYHAGTSPKGRWTVMAEFVDRSWQKNHDPNDDVAFLTVGRRAHRVQAEVESERLVIATKLPQTVQVIGYPDSSNTPIECTAPARPLHLTGYRQMVFDCGGYTEGTSGGPFLIRVSKSTGAGEVIGVIGGYQEGGDLASISYSARFLQNVAALYKRAVAWRP